MLTHDQVAAVAPQSVRIGPIGLEGIFAVPPGATGTIVFAHGSGSSRLSPRNRYVATALQAQGFATLLFDLLLPEEAEDRANVFDIPLLTSRLLLATDWLRHESPCQSAAVGYFGASTGAAAALAAAAQRPEIRAIVSRGGRPDMAGAALTRVQAPTLLIVGGLDPEVLHLNKLALQCLCCVKRLAVVPGASHLFEEPGTLTAVVELASRWFAAHLNGRKQRSS